MKDNNLLFVLVGHNLIKSLINSQGFKQCYRTIFDSFFLANIKEVKEFFPKKIKNKQFFNYIVERIYYFDELEYICANCYSVSLYCQVLAYLEGLNSQLIYGYKKEDGVLVGHAWLIVEDEKKSVFIINPGNICLDDYHVIAALNPREIIKDELKNEILGGN